MTAASDIGPQVGLQHDVCRHAIDRHQSRHVDEFAESRDRLVEAGGLQFELSPRLAEIGLPGVEFLNACSCRASGWMKRSRANSSASELVIGAPEAATCARPGFLAASPCAVAARAGNRWRVIVSAGSPPSAGTPSLVRRMERGSRLLARDGVSRMRFEGSFHRGPTLLSSDCSEDPDSPAGRRRARKGAKRRA